MPTPNEKAVMQELQSSGYEILREKRVNGIPDFKCMKFETGERFYLEVKSGSHDLTPEQEAKIRELIEKGNEVRLAKVGEKKIRYYKLNKNLDRTFLREVAIAPAKKPKANIKCLKCSYEWCTKSKHVHVSCPSCLGKVLNPNWIDKSEGEKK